MTGIPITRVDVGAEKADAIRRAVRAVDRMPKGGRLAQPDNADAFLAFLSDPEVYAPIYSLPRPLTLDAVTEFIADHARQRDRGEGLLFVTVEADGSISGYSDVQVWPDWAAGELGGGMRSDRQSRGEGAKGAAVSFGWMFETLGLQLICETAAPDNVRSARLLDGLGFARKGEVESRRSDGSTRRSLVWEMRRSDWPGL